MTRLRLPAVALALSIASNAWADLKTYDIDPQYQQEIYTALRRVLDSGPPTFGKVELLPSGQLLVNASPETLEQVEKVMPPYNVSVLNAEATLFALEHADVFAKQAAVLRAERSRLSIALAALPGVTVFPSDANMILVRVPDSKHAFEGLKARGLCFATLREHPQLGAAANKVR